MPTDCLTSPPSTAARPALGRAVTWITIFAFALIAFLATSTALLGSWLGNWPWLGAAVLAAVVLAARAGGGRWLTSLSAWRFALLLIALAAGLRLAAVLWLPYTPHGDFICYWRSGENMARTWELRVPAAVLDRPYRAFYPPGQVFALGVMIRLFGSHAWFAAQVLNIVWATLTVLGVWYVGRRLFGEKTGRVAALLAALLPSSVFGCMTLGAEAPQTFWLLAAMCLYVGPVLGRRAWWAALLCGLCLGVGALIRPTYVLIPLVLAVGLLLVRALGRRGDSADDGPQWSWERWLATATCIVAGAAVAVLPWTARNYAVLGGFLPISSNGGGNLNSANNDDLASRYFGPPENRQSGWGSCFTESVWNDLYTRYPDDDLAINRAGAQQAKVWIVAHPVEFVKLAGIKFVLFWYMDRDMSWWATEDYVADRPDLDIGAGARQAFHGISQGFYAAAFVVGAIGLFLRRRDLAWHAAWMAIPLLAMCFTAVHMVFEAQGKYHYMLVPLLLILTALAATNRTDPSNRERPDFMAGLGGSEKAAGEGTKLKSNLLLSCFSILSWPAERYLSKPQQASIDTWCLRRPLFHSRQKTISLTSEHRGAA